MAKTKDVPTPNLEREEGTEAPLAPREKKRATRDERTRKEIGKEKTFTYAKRRIISALSRISSRARFTQSLVLQLTPSSSLKHGNYVSAKYENREIAYLTVVVGIRGSGLSGDENG